MMLVAVFLVLFNHKPYPSAIKWPKTTMLTDYGEAKRFYCTVRFYDRLRWGLFVVSKLKVAILVNPKDAAKICRNPSRHDMHVWEGITNTRTKEPHAKLPQNDSSCTLSQESEIIGAT
jgi:hypothetical protein